MILKRKLIRNGTDGFKYYISRADLCKTLSISDNQVRTAIESMKEQGIIHREGSDRSGVWIIDMKL